MRAKYFRNKTMAKTCCALQMGFFGERYVNIFDIAEVHAPIAAIYDARIPRRRRGHLLERSCVGPFACEGR